MATKKLKSINVTLIDCDKINPVTFTASDTTDNPQATYALDDFDHEKYMHIVTDGEDSKEVYIPFHAVDHIKVSETSETVERPDPYGCSGGGNDCIVTEESDTIFNVEITKTGKNAWGDDESVARAIRRMWNNYDESEEFSTIIADEVIVDGATYTIELRLLRNGAEIARFEPQSIEEDSNYTIAWTNGLTTWTESDTETDNMMTVYAGYSDVAVGDVFVLTETMCVS